MNNYQTNYPQQQYPQMINQQYKQPYYQQQTWLNNQVPQVRPVSSIEEVKASPIEFDGSVFYFPDIANKRIYTKFINMDGTATINLYEQKDLTNLMTAPTQQIDSSMYITRAEFENAINQIKQTYEELLAAKDKKEEKSSTSTGFQF